MIDPHPHADSGRLMLYVVRGYALSISRQQSYVMCNLVAPFQTPL